MNIILKFKQTFIFWNILQNTHKTQPFYFTFEIIEDLHKQINLIISNYLKLIYDIRNLT